MYTPIIELAERLHGILQYNRDAEKSFAFASKKCYSNELAVYFEGMSRQRKYFAEEVKLTIDSLGHNFKSLEHSTNNKSISKHHENKIADKDEVMLQESILREKAVVKEYESLLTDFIMPKPTAITLRNQMLKIETNLALIKSLSDLKKKMLESL